MGACDFDVCVCVRVTVLQIVPLASLLEITDVDDDILCPCEQGLIHYVQTALD